MDEFIERRIVLGLAASQEFTQKIRPDVDITLFEGPELQNIAGWCLENFDKYGRVMGPQIDMYGYEPVKPIPYRNRIGKNKPRL